MASRMSHIGFSSAPLWVLKLSLLVAAGIWGLGTVVIKSTVDEVPPSWIVGLRFFGAGLLLGLVSLPKMTAALRRAPRLHLGRGFILGLFLFGSYWLNSTGLTDTTASNSSFLTTLYVVMIPLLSWAILRKRPSRYSLVAALLCLVGVGAIAYGGAGEFSLRFGDLITIGSALFISFHVLYTSKYAPGASMTVLTVVQFLVAGVLGMVAGIVDGLATGNPLDFGHLSPNAWISIAYLTVFASCIALGLQNAAVAKVDPAQASLFLATECLFGVLFSILLLGESITATAAAGFALIFIGIVVSEYLPLRAAKRATEAEVHADAAEGNNTRALSVDCETTAEAMEGSDAFMR